MTYSNNVTISPEFFKKAFHDYSDRYWAFAREIMQNSIDCGSTRIDVRITQLDDPPRTVVEVRNDGEPMTREVLTGKLLSIGSSGKDFQEGAVGGFGKAKEILYFAHERYEIHSGSYKVTGSGNGYEISPSPHLDGTLSVVIWDGHLEEELGDAFGTFVELCGWLVKATFTVNGEPRRPTLGRGSFRRPVEEDGVVWARVWTALSASNLMVVRINGVPMFTEYCDYKGCVIIELTGKSSERLTANRDGLVHPYRSALRAFITQMTVDRRSALKVQAPAYRRFRGARLGRPAGAGASLSAASTGSDPAPPLISAGRSPGGAGILVSPRSFAEESAVRGLGHDFVLKNCRRGRVPRAFDPGDPAFSDHARWLIGEWAGCLLELHAIFGIDDEFSVGFVFGDDSDAEFEEPEQYGKLYLLNPCERGSGGLKHRFRKSDRPRIVALAAHEFVHGALGVRQHDEDFATELTGVIEKLWQNRRRIGRRSA